MQSEGLTQRKGMAMGKGSEPGGDFGVEKFHSMNGGPITHPDAGMHSGNTLGDHERGVGAHVSRGKSNMPAQSHPDHGPHHHRAEGGGSGGFGVQSFRSMNG